MAQWKQEPTCRQTRLALPSQDQEYTKFITSLDRRSASTMIQFITGHNYLNYHLNKTGKSSTDKCRKCNEYPETSWHLLQYCDALAQTRRSLFILDGPEKTPKPDQMLNFILFSGISKLLRPPEWTGDLNQQYYWLHYPMCKISNP